MAISPFLGLNLYDIASGSATTFLDFRLAVAGNLSNMSILDVFSSDTSASIASLRGSVFQTVSATEFSANNYHATVGTISSYATNMIIVLRLNTSITGSTTININSFGDVLLKKIDTSGNIIDIVSGDLLLNQYYLFQYNGTYFVWIGSVGSTSGSSGAPIDAYYIVSGSSSLLTNEKVITAGSNVSIDNSGSLLIIHSGSSTEGKNYSGSAPISISGSVISHNISGIASGSYNQVQVDVFGHVVSGSVSNGISSITGSGIMSTTTGSVVKHNTSAVTAGGYLSANIIIDDYGHITSAENGVSASSVGAPSDSAFVTTASSLSLTNYYIATAGSRIILENATGSLIIHAEDQLSWINVKDYGALGDGITDDTVSINDAIASIPSEGAVLYFPQGEYVTSGGFILSNPTQVLGDGGANYYGTSSISQINCTSASSSLFTVSALRGKFFNIALINSSVSDPTNGAAITVASSDLHQKIDYDHVSVYGFYNCIDVQTGAYWSMDSCFLMGPILYALKIQNTENVDAGDWAISNSWFVGKNQSATSAIRIESSGGGKIINCKINATDVPSRFQYGIDVAFSSPTATSDYLFANSSIEGIIYNGVRVSINSGAQLYQLFLNTLQIYNNDASYSAIDVSAEVSGGITNLVIAENILCNTYTSALSAISLTNATTGYVGGNVQMRFADILSQTGCSGITGTGGSVNSVGTGTGLTGGPITDTGTISLSDTSVSPGNYTNSNITVDQQGRITHASSGTNTSGEILIQDGSSAPPIMLTNELEDDFLYEG